MMKLSKHTDEFWQIFQPASIEYCLIPKTRDEMQQHYDIATREYFRKNVLKPLLESWQLRMTIPDKPNSRNQKYAKVLENDRHEIR
jgi:ATP-dependent DNA helicase RecG